jgi:filamentous hemagglutinin
MLIAVSELASTVSKALGQKLTSNPNRPKARLALAKASVFALSLFFPFMALASASVSVSLGAQKSETKEHNEQSLSAGSAIQAGGQVNLIATGLGKVANDTISANTGSDIVIQGSNVSGAQGTHLFADDDINLIAGTNTQSMKSSNKSSSASIGVSFGGGAQNGFAINIGVSGAKGKANGSDLTHNESVVGNANSTTTFQSGDDTNLIGSQLIGKAVKGDVGGNLNILSLQDKSTYDAKQTSAGVSVSICVPPICAGASSISGSFGQDKTHANYASVKEVAGIYAGDGGFDVNVKGQTELTGAVIASTAAANQNHLKTGTLQTHDIQNQSDYKASSLNVSASYSGKETTKQTDAQGNTTIVPKQATDKNGAPVNDSNGNPVQAQSGIKGMNASLPSAMQAADSASSVTQSGISQGAIELTSNEQDSANALANLNRNVDANAQTATGLDNLYQRDKDKIAQGFEITRQLAQNANTFMSHMAKDLDAARAEKAALQTQSQAMGNAPILAPDGTQATLADGTPLTIKDLNDPAFNAAIAANPQLGQARDAYNQTNQDLAKAQASYDTRQALWGSGGYGSMIVSGLVGAASGNVTGSGAALLQNSAINVVRQLGAQEIKGIADGFMDNGKPNTQSELIRGALHAIAGCAGASATGGDCASAAAGSAATVGLNNLIAANTENMTAEQKQAYSNLMGTLVAGVASGVGGDAAAAQLASKIEVENNYEVDEIPGMGEFADKLYHENVACKAHPTQECMVNPVVVVAGVAAAPAVVQASVLTGIGGSLVTNSEYKLSDLTYDATIGALIDKGTSSLVRASNPSPKNATRFFEANSFVANSALGKLLQPAINKYYGSKELTIFPNFNANRFLKRK